MIVCRRFVWLTVWVVALLAFGGSTCCLQQRFCHEDFVVVASGSAASVLDSFGVPRGTGGYFLGVLAFSLFPPKTGAYDVGTLSQMLSRCMYGQQKLFLVQILPGHSDVETLDRLQNLPFLDHSQRWEAPYEGFYPDSYYVAWGTPLRQVLSAAQARLFDFAKSLWNQRGNAVQHLSARQMIILASLVEQETSLQDEYEKIAEVFLRRLGPNLSGRLYACTTIQYVFAQNPQWRRRKMRRIFYKDLYTKHPYNTYRRSGLPPGPIANPSPAALRAVASLDKLSGGVSYFFWCKEKRRHIFSVSLQEHLARQTRLQQKSKFIV